MTPHVSSTKYLKLKSKVIRVRKREGYSRGGGAATAFHANTLFRVFCFFFVSVFVIRVLFFNLEKLSLDEEGKLGEGEEAGVFLTGGAGDPASPAALLQKADR